MLTWTGPVPGSSEPLFQIAFSRNGIAPPIRPYRRSNTIVSSSGDGVLLCRASTPPAPSAYLRRPASPAAPHGCPITESIHLRAHPRGRSGGVRAERCCRDLDPRRRGRGARLARPRAALLPVQDRPARGRGPARHPAGARRALGTRGRRRRRRGHRASGHQSRVRPFPRAALRRARRRREGRGGDGDLRHADEALSRPARRVPAARDAARRSRPRVGRAPHRAHQPRDRDHGAGRQPAARPSVSHEAAAEAVEGSDDGALRRRRAATEAPAAIQPASALTAGGPAVLASGVAAAESARPSAWATFRIARCATAVALAALALAGCDRSRGTAGGAASSSATKLRDRAIAAAGGRERWAAIEDVAYASTFILYGPMGEVRSETIGIQKEPLHGSPPRVRFEPLGMVEPLVLGFDGKEAWAFRGPRPLAEEDRLVFSRFNM